MIANKVRPEDKALTRKLARLLKQSEQLQEQLVEVLRDANALGCHDQAMGAIEWAVDCAVKTTTRIRSAHTESLKIE